MKTVLQPPSATLRTKRYLSSIRISCKRGNLISRQPVIRNEKRWGVTDLHFELRADANSKSKRERMSVQHWKSLLRLLEGFLIIPAFGLLCFPTNVCFVFFFLKGLLTGSLALISIYIHKITSFFKEIFMCNGRLNAGVFWAVLIVAILCPVRIQTYNAGRSGFVFWWNQN